MLLQRIDSLKLSEDLAAAMKAICEAACLAAEIAIYAGDFEHQRGLGKNYTSELMSDGDLLATTASEARTQFQAVQKELVAAQLSFTNGQPSDYEGTGSSAHGAALRYAEIIRDGANRAAQEIKDLFWDHYLANDLFAQHLKILPIDAARVADEMLKEAVKAAQQRNSTLGHDSLAEFLTPGECLVRLPFPHATDRQKRHILEKIRKQCRWLRNDPNHSNHIFADDWMLVCAMLRSLRLHNYDSGAISAGIVALPADPSPEQIERMKAEIRKDNQRKKTRRIAPKFRDQLRHTPGISWFIEQITLIQFREISVPIATQSYRHGHTHT